MLPTAKIIADNIQDMTRQGSELSQPELAKRMGIGSKTFWTMKEGLGNPQLGNIEKAARYFKRPVWHLLIPHGHNLPRDFDPFKVPLPTIEAGHVRIPVLEAIPSVGPSGEPVDWPAVLDHIDIAEGWARRHLGQHIECIRVLPVRGDSMSPTINEGDLAFVDTASNRFETDSIYVIVWNGRLLIKRLTANLVKNCVEVSSDNPINPTQEIPAGEIDGLHICGRVKAWLAIKGY